MMVCSKNTHFNMQEKCLSSMLICTKLNYAQYAEWKYVVVKWTKPCNNNTNSKHRSTCKFVAYHLLGTSWLNKYISTTEQVYRGSRKFGSETFSVLFTCVRLSKDFYSKIQQIIMYKTLYNLFITGVHTYIRAICHVCKLFS